MPSGRSFGQGFIDIGANTDPFIKAMGGLERVSGQFLKKGITIPIRLSGGKEFKQELGKLSQVASTGFAKTFTGSFDPSGFTRGAAKLSESFGKVDDSTDKAKAGIRGVLSALDDARPGLAAAIRGGGSLATAMNRLGLAGLPLGTATSRLVGLTVAVQDASPALKELGGQFPRLTAGVARFTATLAGLSTIAITGWVGVILTAITALTALYKLTQRGIPLVLESQQAYMQVAAALNATGNAAGVSISQLEAFNDSLEDLTGTSSTELTRIESILGSFDNIKGPERFQEAVRLSNDMMVRFGTSAKEAARSIGLALQDPARGVENLGEQGIRFNKIEKETIDLLTRHGDILGAQDVVLAKLNRTVGKAAEAQGQSLAGSFQKLQNETNDLAQTLAKVFVPALAAIADVSSKIVGFIDDFVKALLNLDETVQSSPIAKAFFELATATAAGVGPALRLAQSLYGAGDAHAEAADKAKAQEDQITLLTDAFDELTKTQETAVRSQIDADRARLAQERGVIDLRRAQEDLTEAQRVYDGTLNGFPETSKEAVKAIREFNEAALEAEQATLSEARAKLELTRSEEELEEARENHRKVTQGYSRDSEEAIEAIDALEDATRELTRAQLDLEQAQNRLKESQLELSLQQKLAGYVQKAYGSSSYAAIRAAVEVEKTQLGVRDAQLDVADSQNGIGDAQRAYQEQLRETNGILYGYATNTKEAKKALQELQDAEYENATSVLALRSAQIRTKEAVNDHTEAQRVLDGVLKGFPKTSEEYQDALRDLEDAHHEHKSTLIDQRSLMQDLHRAIRDSAKAMQDLVKGQEAYNRAVARAKEDDVVLGYGPPAPGKGYPIVKRRRFGGPIMPGESAWVGEGGPELITAGTRGLTVTPIKKSPSKPIYINISKQPAVINFDGRTIMRVLLPHMQALIRENN